MKLHHSNPEAVRQAAARRRPQRQDVLASLIDAVAKAGIELPENVKEWAAQQAETKEQK